MRKLILFTLIISITFIFIGCATITHRPISESEDKTNKNCLRYNQNSVYVLIHQDWLKNIMKL